MVLCKINGLLMLMSLLHTISTYRYQGEIDSQEDWVFLFRGCFNSWEGLTYNFEFPLEYSSINLLFYFNRPGLWQTVYNTNLTCQEKQNKLNPRFRQVVDLINDPLVDCKNVTSENIYRCHDSNYFRSWHPSWWYFVVARCNQTDAPGIKFKYDINMTNFYGKALDRDDSGSEELWIRKNDLPAVAIAFIVIGSLMVAGAFIALCIVVLRKGSKRETTKNASSRNRTTDITTVDEKKFDNMAFDMANFEKPPMGHMNTVVNMH